MGFFILEYGVDISDMVGKKFNRWTVLKFAGRKRHSKTSTSLMWLCKCECGVERIVQGSQIQRGHSKSCGCLQKDITRKRSLIDLTGQQFGKLKVIKNVGPYKKTRKLQYVCVCDCGKEVIAFGGHLRSGHTQSCGCYMREVSSKTAIERMKTQSPSKSEILLGDYIENEYHIKLDRSFPIKNRLYDIRYKSILIESDGSYWHSKPTDIKNDKYKDELAKLNGYTLLRFNLDSEAQLKCDWNTKIKPILDKFLLTI